MKAITTKFVPCTDTRGSRIRASEPDGRSVSIPYPHELDSEAGHRKAAQALCERLGWTGRLIGGGVRGGMVWVFDDGDTATTKGE